MSDRPDKPTREQVEFTKKIWTAMQEMFISDVAALIATRELAVEGAAVEGAAIERATQLLLAMAERRRGNMTGTDIVYCNAAQEVRALISPTDRLALDRYVEEAEHKGWLDCLRNVQGSIEGYPNNGGDIEIMKGIERIVEEKVLSVSDELARLLLAHDVGGASFDFVSAIRLYARDLSGGCDVKTGE